MRINNKEYCNRAGRFSFPRTMFEDGLVGEMLEAMSDILIIKAEADFMRDCVQYWGYSKHFHEVVKGGEIPTYYAVFETTKAEPDENGVIKLTSHFKGWEHETY